MSVWVSLNLPLIRADMCFDAATTRRRSTNTLTLWPRALEGSMSEPSAQLLDPQDVPVRQEGEAIVRVLVGEGSPVELGTPGLILDVELPGAEPSAARSRPTSTASCTCWKARPALAPTHGGRAARRLPFSERVARLRWSMRSPGRASCSWPESRTERCPTSTDRTWTDGRRQHTSVARPNSSMRVPAGTRP
jgi:hypothetical protein